MRRRGYWAALSWVAVGCSPVRATVVEPGPPPAAPTPPPTVRTQPSQPAAPSCTSDADVEDEALRRAVRRQVRLSDDLPATPAEMALVTRLAVGLDPGFVGSLRGIHCLPNLKELRISVGAASDLTPLCALHELEVLDLSDHGVKDLTPLGGLLRLRTLLLSRNDIEDLGPLTRLTELRQLALLHNRIADLTPLAGLRALEDLDLSRNQVADLTPLSGLTSLQVLDLSHNAVSDLRPLADLRELRWLGATHNRIADVAPLANAAQLTGLWLSDNPLASAAALAPLGPFDELDLPPAVTDGPREKPQPPSPVAVMPPPGRLPAPRVGPGAPSLRAACDTIHRRARQLTRPLLDPQHPQSEVYRAVLKDEAPHFGQCFPTRRGAWAFDLLEVRAIGFVWELVHLDRDGSRASLRAPDLLTLDRWGHPPSAAAPIPEDDGSGRGHDGLFYRNGTDLSHLSVEALYDFDGDGEEELVVTSGRAWAHEWLEAAPEVWVWTFTDGAIRPYAAALGRINDDVIDWNRDGRPDLLRSEPYHAWEMSCDKDGSTLVAVQRYLAWAAPDGSFRTSGAPAESFLTAQCPTRPASLVRLPQDRSLIGAAGNAHEVWWLDSVATGRALFCARAWGESAPALRAQLDRRCSSYVESGTCTAPLGLRECPTWLRDWAELDPPTVIGANQTPR
jgi:hypothetical protein